MIIQIYAFTQVDQAVAAAEMGVDHIGFIAGDYGLVSGELSFKEARRLAQSLPSHTVRVALTMAVQVDEILRMAEAVEPDIIHISTDLEDVGMRCDAAPAERAARVCAPDESHPRLRRGEHRRRPALCPGYRICSCWIPR